MGSPVANQLKLVLNLNDTTIKVPFRYRIKNQSIFIMKGKLNLLQFQLRKSLQSLNKAFFEEHQGPTGVSKTWPIVDVTFKAPFKKFCGEDRENLGESKEP